MERVFSSKTPSLTGERVKIAGWVATRRDHGKLVFLDIRDKEGIVQVVCNPGNAEAHAIAQQVRPEWVLEITGMCQTRPSGMTTESPQGSIEVVAETIVVLGQAQTSPFPLDTEGYEIEEEKRLRYRYLDLRRERLKRNLTMRHRVMQFMREFLIKEEFIEIETPILSKSTPEGARDYVVPSRLYPGKFYALPQSPQQYKQLLQVAGFEKYFQIARCFRDEDPRADRQPEFTQLDLEMSFVKREDIMQLNERLLIEIVKVLYPEKEIQEIPFPVMQYKEAMEKYGTDRPDLRMDKKNPNLLAFCWVVDFPFFEEIQSSPSTGSGSSRWTFTHNPFSAPKQEYMNDLMEKRTIKEILTTQYDIVLNGSEIGGGSMRNHNPQALERVFEIMGYEKDRIKENFGHILEALSYGTPPHGGIAWGFDRLFSLLQQEPNIREVMAFPKTGDVQDPMMGSPAEISKEQLEELSLRLEKRNKK